MSLSAVSSVHLVSVQRLICNAQTAAQVLCHMSLVFRVDTSPICIISGWKRTGPCCMQKRNYSLTTFPLYSTLEKVEAAVHRQPEVTAAGYIYDTLREWKRVWSWRPRGIWCQKSMVPILSFSSAACWTAAQCRATKFLSEKLWKQQIVANTQGGMPGNLGKRLNEAA